jgi:hypothetical protein
MDGRTSAAGQARTAVVFPAGTGRPFERLRFCPVRAVAHRLPPYGTADAEQEYCAHLELLERRAPAAAGLL